MSAPGPFGFWALYVMITIKSKFQLHWLWLVKERACVVTSQVGSFPACNLVWGGGSRQDQRRGGREVSQSAALDCCLLPQEDFAAIFKVWIVSYTHLHWLAVARTPTLGGLEMRAQGEGESRANRWVVEIGKSQAKFENIIEQSLLVHKKQITSLHLLFIRVKTESGNKYNNIKLDQSNNY